MDAQADKTQDDKTIVAPTQDNPTLHKIVQSATAVTKTPDFTIHIQNLSYDDHT